MEDAVGIAVPCNVLISDITVAARIQRHRAELVASEVPERLHHPKVVPDRFPPFGATHRSLQVVDYNEVRPHSALDGRTPTEYAQAAGLSQ